MELHGWCKWLREVRPIFRTVSREIGTPLSQLGIALENPAPRAMLLFLYLLRKNFPEVYAIKDYA
jgi:hypothetical protein